MENNLVFCHTYTTKNGERKTFRIVSGSVTDLEDFYDVVVCSAYRGCYVPLEGTLIGALFDDMQISVELLAKDKAFVLDDVHCWLSQPTNTRFERIACVEITSLMDFPDETTYDAHLKRLFSSLRMLLEYAAMRGVKVENIVLPILGTGFQRLSVAEVAGPLVKQLFYAMETIDALSSITVCEYTTENAKMLADIVKKIISPSKHASPDVFISYSSRQIGEALDIRNRLTAAGVSCWMAPDSIPTGSQYWQEIPIALANTKVLVLLLTPDAENSKWVPKEVNTAIENRSVIIPFQPYDYHNSAAFRFILSDVQIIHAWNYDEDVRMDHLISEVQRALRA